MKVVEAIVQILVDEGVDTIFGIPGIHTLGLYDVLHRSKKPRHVLVRHEQAAVFSALGYSLTTNRPGVSLVVPGPGVLNTASAVAEAYYQYRPIVLLAADIPSHMRGKGMFHEVDSLKMLEPITKARFFARTAGDVVPSLREAFKVATEGRPGPVYVAVPQDVLQAREEVDSIGSKRVAAKPTLDLKQVKEAASLLREHPSSFLWAGTGLAFSGGTDGLTQLAERLKMPVMTTMGARGCVSEDHPLSLGAPGFGFPFSMFKEADLAMALGVRFGSLNTYLGQLPPPKVLIRVDAGGEDPRGEDRERYRPALDIQADPGEFVMALLKELEPFPGREYGDNRLIGFLSRAESGGEETLSALASSNDTPVKPPRFMKALTDALGGREFTYMAESTWAIMKGISPSAVRPLRFGIIRSFGCLGFGLPAAIGAAVAHPDLLAVSISGDGGFLFSCQEIATAAEESVGNLVHFVLADHGFRGFRYIQKELFQGRYIASGWKPLDFAKVAEGFGAKGYTISSPEEIDPVLSEVLKGRGPSVVAVLIDDTPNPQEEMFVGRMKAGDRTLGV